MHQVPKNTIREKMKGNNDNDSNDAVIDALFGESDDEVETMETGLSLLQQADIRVTEVRESLSDVGGHRGVFARVNIPAGTLVVAEVPVMTWPTTFDFESVENVVLCVEAIMSNLKAYETSCLLHPRNLTADADEEDITLAREFLGNENIQLLASKCNLTDNEVIRVYLTLQHNGFQSGLYGTLTLVNHSCEPNCIKFSPNHASGLASEIWATRAISAGEELTICYVEPMEQTSASLRQYLWAHHRFHCCCASCRIHTSDREEAAEKAEKEAFAANFLQTELQSMETELLWQQADSVTGDTVKTLYNMMKNIANLLSKHFGTPEDASHVTNEDMVGTEDSNGDPDDKWRLDKSKHIRLIARAHKLGTTIAAKSLEIIPQLASTKRPKAAALKKIILGYLYHSVHWRAVQSIYIGDVHPDVATSSQDIAQALQLALQECSPSDVQSMFPTHLFPWSANRHSMEQEKQHREKESAANQKMYNTLYRYPQSKTVLRESGSVFWGIIE